MSDARVIPFDESRRRPAVSAGSRAAGATGPGARKLPASKRRGVPSSSDVDPALAAPRSTTLGDVVSTSAVPQEDPWAAATATEGTSAHTAPESDPRVGPDPGADEPPREAPTEGMSDPITEAVGKALGFLIRRVTGDYEVDEFGHDPDLTDNVLAAALRPLYDKWFRVETVGIDNVPSVGGALVVANHSGTIALDSLMTQLALLDHHPARRSLRMLGADLVFSTPIVGEVARKAGHTLACQPDAERLLSKGEVVGVWPEGFKGIGKPFSERYKLQRFGRGGFVSAALRAGVPIIPAAIVGAEEIYPMIANATSLARVLGLPYFPITPTFPWLGPLGLVPLPSKWVITFGDPIRTDHYPEGAADDPMLVFNLTDEVRETIQQMLYRALVARGGVFG